MATSKSSKPHANSSKSESSHSTDKTKDNRTHSTRSEGKEHDTGSHDTRSSSRADETSSGSRTPHSQASSDKSSDTSRGSQASQENLKGSQGTQHRSDQKSGQASEHSSAQSHRGGDQKSSQSMDRGGTQSHRGGDQKSGQSMDRGGMQSDQSAGQKSGQQSALGNVDGQDRSREPQFDEQFDRVSAVDTLNNLLIADFDAIGLYDRVLQSIDNEQFRGPLIQFREDHQRHINDLTQAIRNIQGEPMSRPSLMGPIAKVMASMASTLMGNKGSLQALYQGEQYVKNIYDQAPVGGLPTQLRELVARNAEDEHRHSQWVRETLDNL